LRAFRRDKSFAVPVGALNGQTPQNPDKSRSRRRQKLSFGAHNADRPGGLWRREFQQSDITVAMRDRGL